MKEAMEEAMEAAWLKKTELSRAEKDTAAVAMQKSW